MAEAKTLESYHLYLMSSAIYCGTVFYLRDDQVFPSLQSSYILVFIQRPNLFSRQLCGAPLPLQDAHNLQQVMSLGNMAEDNMTNISDDNRMKIEKLHGRSNWASWKFEMEMVLMEKDLWDVTTQEPETPSLTDKIKRQQQRARARIALSLDRSEQLHVRSIQSPAAMWEALCSIYDAKDQASQLVKRSQFLTMTMSTSEGIQSWMSRVKTEAANAKDIGCSITDDDSISVLLNGLTDTYRTTRKVLLGQASVAKTTLKWDDVTRALIADEASELASSEGVTAFWSDRDKPKDKRSGNKADNQKKGECFWCGKQGHWESDCRKKAAGEPKNEAAARQRETKRPNTGGKKKPSTYTASVEASPITFSAQVIGFRSVKETALHYLDTGTNEHQFLDRNDFTTYQPVGGLTVRTQTKGNQVSVIGKGNAVLRSVVNGRVEVLNFPDALHVPDGEANLVSFGALLEKGARIELSGTTINVYHGNRLAMVLTMKNRMWPIPVSPKKATSTSGIPKALYSAGPKPSMELWHQRLGHISPKTITRMANMVCGMEKVEGKLDGACTGCQLGKGHRDPFPTSSNSTAKPLELVHCDIAGPMQTPSPDGSRFAVLFIDDYSRMHFVAIVIHKSDAFQIFKELVAMLERQTSYKIERFRTDQEPVFTTSHAANKYYGEHGITHETTVTYSPSQNGVSERGIRSTVESARAMIQTAMDMITFKQSDQRLWGEACKTSVYLINRTPHKPTGDTTPYEIFFGKKPDIGHLRVFGSVAYTHIPKEKRQGKFGAHRRLGIFVGYPDNQKAWKFFDPTNSTFYTAREASFFEISRIETVDVEEDQGEPEDSFEEHRRSESERLHGQGSNEPSRLDLTNPTEPINDQESGLGGADGQHDHGRQPEGSFEEHRRSESERLHGQGPSQAIRSDLTNPTEAIHGRESGPGKANQPTQPTRVQPERTNRPRNEWQQNLRALNAVISPSADNIPKSFTDAMNSDESDYWTEAIHREYQSLEANGTWELVDLPKGRKAIDSKWVFALKRDVNGNIERYKARLVARGFKQEEGVDYFETFSPVARTSSIRIILALVAMYDYELAQADAITAFLNSSLDEKLYMKQPEGFEAKGKEDKVCLLVKSIYGLKQAGRNWYLQLCDHLHSLGFESNISDICVWVQFTDNGPIILATIVDDLIIAARTLKMTEDVILGLEKLFKLRRIDKIEKFVGLEIIRDRPNRKIFLGQQRYALEVLDRFDMTKCKPVSTPMDANQLRLYHGDGTPTDKREYLKAIGSLLYLATGTRPDLAYAVGLLSRYVAEPNHHHNAGVKRVLRYLKGTMDTMLTLGGNPTRGVIGYSDASHADDPRTGRSTTGYVFTLGDGAITWSSKRQTLVALSTTEAEYLAGTEGAKEALWIKGVMEGMGIEAGKLPLYGDNHGALALSDNSEFHARTKHFNLRRVAPPLATCSHWAMGRSPGLPRDRRSWLYRRRRQNTWRGPRGRRRRYGSKA